MVSETTGGDVNCRLTTNSLLDQGGANIEKLAVEGAHELGRNLDVDQPGGWRDIESLSCPVKHLQKHLRTIMNESQSDE